MRKLIFSTLASISLMSGAFTLDSSISIAAAKDCSGINCDQPIGMKNGPYPVWTVLRCVVGDPGKYRTVGCKSPEALHLTPRGKMGVCFIGSDSKVHWDNQREVHVGRSFINRRIGGRWQPDWQSPRS